MGRNGRNSDAAAMLNMLPKLELVPITMYFMMLAKLRRPSTIAVVQDGQVRLQQDDLAPLLRHVHPLSTEMPTSAVCSDGASLMPSPR